MKHALYISSTDESASIQNTANREVVLQQLGFSVTRYASKTRGLTEILQLIPHIHTYTVLYIRIDGSCRLDKFSLLKLIRPSLRIVWEIHGFPEENYQKQQNSCSYRYTAIKRRIYSLFADGYIFVSEELQHYAKKKILYRPQMVIPNFIVFHPKRATFKNRITGNKQMRYVLWVGNGAYPWHALDTLEQVAKLSYRQNKHIRFVLISPYLWHTFSWYKNIIFITGAPNNVVHTFIQQSDICLALYHKPPACPFYFSPLKILDYMINKKPVIATGFGQINTVITNGVNGYTTNNKPEDIVEKIQYLLTHPKTKRMLGEQGYNTVMRQRSFAQAKKAYKALFSLLWQ
ncbi:MAG: glycosyltransferase family 4 protein [Microgenomates group bacterium]